MDFTSSPIHHAVWFGLRWWCQFQLDRFPNNGRHVHTSWTRQQNFFFLPFLLSNWRVLIKDRWSEVVDHVAKFTAASSLGLIFLTTCKLLDHYYPLHNLDRVPGWQDWLFKRTVMFINRMKCEVSMVRNETWKIAFRCLIVWIISTLSDTGPPGCLNVCLSSLCLWICIEKYILRWKFRKWINMNNKNKKWTITFEII